MILTRIRGNDKIARREEKFLMARTVSIGGQDFERIVEKDCFYVEKKGSRKVSLWQGQLQLEDKTLKL